MEKQKEFFADDFLKRKRNYDVTIPTEAILLFVKVALIGGILIYSFGVAKGKKLAA